MAVSSYKPRDGRLCATGGHTPRELIESRTRGLKGQDQRAAVSFREEGPSGNESGGVRSQAKLTRHRDRPEGEGKPNAGHHLTTPCNPATHHNTLPHLATPCHTSMHLFDGDIGGNEHHQRFLRGLHTVLSDTWKTTWCCRWACQSSARTHTHTLRTTTMQCNATQCKLSVRHLMTADS